MGLIAQNLSTNGKGFVITEGLLAGLNTGSTVAGAPVWLGVDGNLIYGLVGKPYAPAHLVFIGIVTRAHNNNGEIFVKVQNGFELDELHDVDLKSILPTDGQVLQFDGATGLWRNNTLSTGLTVGSTTISSGTNGRVLFQNGGVLQQSSNLFWDNTNGRLGVGTSTPASSGGGISSIINIYRAAGNSMLTLTVGTNAWDVANVGGTGIWFINNNSTKAILFNNGNLAIGTTTNAGFRLDVNGTARFGATTVTAPGALSTDIAFRVRNSANTLDIIRAQGDGNVFVGLGAGNVNTGANNTFIGISSGLVNTSGANNVGFGLNTLRANTTGQENVAISVNALLSNTTASYNIAIGINSVRTNTTGSANIGIGVNSLYENTTGSNNTAFGYGSSQKNTTGNSNVSFGVNALLSNTTGSNNIALGQSSGRYIANGVTETTINNNSIFIGYDSKALADNQTNQIVIGHGSIGLGSNTAVIGNSSTTLFRPFGNVAIGADTAGARLDVRAQGALSTDNVFRIRNSANTVDILKIAGNGNLSYNAQGGGIALLNNDGTTDIGSGGGSVTRINLLSGTTSTINMNPAGTIGTIFNSTRGGASGETAFLFNASIGNLAGTTNYGKIINIKDGRTDLGNRANTVVGLLIQRDSANTNTLLNVQALSTTTGNVGFGILINNASAKVQIDSTTQGFLPPRMTNAQRLAIASPAVGLMVYCTDLVEGLYVYKSMGWTFVI
jgi:hypothetical protein